MVEPITTTLLGSKLVGQALSKPLNDLYEYLKVKASINIDLNKLRNIDQNIAKKAQSVKMVKTIYKGDEAIDLENFFYCPTVFYGNKKISFDKLTSENTIIEGIAGQGKSILMRYLVYKEYQLSNRIPIFIELRKINSKGNIVEFIRESISNWIFDVNDELLHKIFESGKLTIFLDGFDELKKEDMLSIITELEKISVKYEQTKIIISSRPDNEIQSSNFFKVVKIKPYSKLDQHGLIRILVEENDSYENIINALKSSSLDVEELLSTPLMATLFVMTYRAKLVIPDSLSKFYDDLFSVLIYKHDRTKPGYQREFKSKLNEKTLQEWFELFCFLSKNKRNLSFSSRKEILDCISLTLTKKFENENPSALLDDITKNLCLILRDGNSYNYTHKTIQEFYTACFIKNKNEDISEKIYGKIIKQLNYYKSELSFLNEIDKYKYSKFLLIPLLTHFFYYFKSEDDFLKSFYVVLTREDRVKADLVLKVNLNGSDLDTCNFIGVIIGNKFIRKMVNLLFNEYEKYNIVGVGGSISYVCDVSENKISKSFRVEAEFEIREFYKELNIAYKEALELVRQEEDESIVDLI